MKANIHNRVDVIEIPEEIANSVEKNWALKFWYEELKENLVYDFEKQCYNYYIASDLHHIFFSTFIKTYEDLELHLKNYQYETRFWILNNDAPSIFFLITINRMRIKYEVFLDSENRNDNYVCFTVYSGREKIADNSGPHSEMIESIKQVVNESC